MQHIMDYQNNIRHTLTALVDIFENGAIELVSSMFCRPAAVTQHWEVAEMSEARFDYIFRLISENNQYKSNVIIGASYPAIKTTLGSEVSLDEARDAFGEFGNCYNALLMGEPAFVEQFGFLTQRVPEDSTVLACFPLAWGIQGYLQVEEQWLFVRYSIEENKFREDLLAFLKA